MKTIRALFTAAAIILLTVHQAWAVDTTQTYQSGMLVLVFLGVCALIIVAQMVPALILMLESSYRATPCVHEITTPPSSHSLTQYSSPCDSVCSEAAWAKPNLE